MTSKLIDFREISQPANDLLPGLQARLVSLVGEPFAFARVSYGDELTLHFGDVRPARSPKLNNLPYGAYILGMRGSPWVLKSGCQPLVLTGEVNIEPLLAGIGQPICKEAIETQQFITPESRVLAATPFVVKPVNGFGLQIRLADGSSLLVLPAVPEFDESSDEGLGELADWELLTPHGLLSAGPGPKWSFTLSAA